MDDDKDKYGDFEEVVDENAPVVETPEGENVPIRLRRPRDGEFIGIIEQRLGGNRMSVKCIDGKTRNCRVPGRFKRSMWLRPRDVVIVKPWPDDDEKGDIIFQYNKGAAYQLRKKGILSGIDEGF